MTLQELHDKQGKIKEALNIAHAIQSEIDAAIKEHAVEKFSDKIFKYEGKDYSFDRLEWCVSDFYVWGFQIKKDGTPSKQSNRLYGIHVSMEELFA